MAMKDAKIKYLEHELEEKERALDLLREADRRDSGRPVAGSDDNRTAALERRVRELEAVLKGLTEEVLDLKAQVQKISRLLERDGSPVPARIAPASRPTGSAEPAPTILVHPRNVDKLSPQNAPARPAEASPTPDEEMDLIMQPDGTIRPEKRIGKEYIIAPNGFQNRRQDRKSGQDRAGRHVDAVIFAEEKELPRPPKKR